ncbi:hypothetical protein EYF80_059423 [Liparis tanakae]|uniref:Uncharacterized protein n=1 Tax=Liparis tanakae TaxID=230148 RepID=A0A4Z2ENA7_9TELE|nr:hypothetical protein EYF80_059423 [Liparis tanakae]
MFPPETPPCAESRVNKWPEVLWRCPSSRSSSRLTAAALSRAHKDLSVHLRDP